MITGGGFIRIDKLYNGVNINKTGVGDRKDIFNMGDSDVPVCE